MTATHTVDGIADQLFAAIEAGDIEAGTVTRIDEYLDSAHLSRLVGEPVGGRGLDPLPAVIPTSGWW